MLMYLGHHPIATKWDGEDNKHPGFGPEHSGYEGVEGLGKYERVAPANFQGPDSGDHQFMNSMIMNYALELADDSGKPTGKFVFKKKHARLAAQEILSTHMSMTDAAEREAFLEKNFENAWTHYDTAGAGQLDVQTMLPFFRYMLGNNQIYFD